MSIDNSTLFLQGYVEDLSGAAKTESVLGSFASEASHLMGSSDKDIHLWMPLLRVHPKWRRFAQKIGDCKKKGTLVAGPDFIKAVEDIKVGERVYAGNGDITTVISTTVKKSYNPMITLHTKGGLPLEVTADHKVLAYRFGEFIDNNKRYQRRYCPGTVKKAQGSRNTSVLAKRATIFTARKAELIEVKDLRPTDYLLCPTNIKFDKQIPDDMLPFMGDTETKWLIGLFLGDGCVPKTKKSALTWACTTDEPEIESRLCDALNSMQLQWNSRFNRKKRSKKARVVVVHKAEIARLFYKYFYNSAGDKVLPSWAICDDVIQGLLDADGHISKGRQILSTTSPSLLHGTRLWAINAGYVPSMNYRDRKDKRNGKKWKRSYQVAWNIDKSARNLWRDEEYLAMPITKIEVHEGPHDEVYDIGVQHRDHTFLDGSGVTISNCVAWGGELAVTMDMAINDIVRGIMSFPGEAATEPIYGGSRVEALGKRFGGWSDGAFGYACAKWLSEAGGVILRDDYSKVTGISSHNLVRYDGKKAKDWGNFGCGGQDDAGKLDAIAKKSPAAKCVRVKTIEEALSAIENGLLLTIASMAGFGNMKRDQDGVCKIVNQWAHQMMIGARRFFKGKPQFRCFQSWGDSCSGPDPGIEELVQLATGNDQLIVPVQSGVVDPFEWRRRLVLPSLDFPYYTRPEDGWNPISACSWWIDERDMAWILRTGDCWAVGSVQGFEKKEIDWNGLSRW